MSVSNERITGKSFDFTINGMTVNVKSATLDITDNSKVTTTNGIPDGWCSGECTAAGEIELDMRNKDIFRDLARAAGSWREIPEADLMFFAKAGSSELKVEAFGCKIILSSLLNVDPKGGEASTTKLKYEVSSPDFVKIDGIPVLSASDVRNMMG